MHENHLLRFQMSVLLITCNNDVFFSGKELIELTLAFFNSLNPRCRWLTHKKRQKAQQIYKKKELKTTKTLEFARSRKNFIPTFRPPTCVNNRDEFCIIWHIIKRSLGNYDRHTPISYGGEDALFQIHLFLACTVTQCKKFRKPFSG